MSIHAVSRRHHNTRLPQNPAVSTTPFQRNPFHSPIALKIVSVEPSIKTIQICKIGINERFQRMILPENFRDEQLPLRRQSQQFFIRRRARQKVTQTARQIVVVQHALFRSAVKKLRGTQGGSYREMNAIFETTPVSGVLNYDGNILCDLFRGCRPAKCFAQESLQDRRGIFAVSSALSLANEFFGAQALGFHLIVLHQPKRTINGRFHNIDRRAMTDEILTSQPGK